MKQRIITFVLAVFILLCAIPAAATETTVPTETTEPTIPERAPGYCGESILWNFSGGVLTITGTGRMDDFPGGSPWEEHKDEIHTVIISGGITYVGAHSFYNYDRLTTVQFGSDVIEIGERAFLSCDGLTAIYLPASFTTFGPCSFMGCSRLKEIHCEGVFPHFRFNCMWDTYATIYYPAERPWPLDEIINLEEAFHGRIEFLASDGTDPYDPGTPPAQPEVPGDTPTEAPTEAPTQAPTEAPTEPSTEPATEPTTEPATEPTTVPTTEEATGEVTEPSTTLTQEPTGESTEGTDVPTEPESEAPKKNNRILLPVIVGGAALVVAFSSVAYIIVRIFFQKPGKFSRKPDHKDDKGNV